jgi:hypothetical protein
MEHERTFPRDHGRRTGARDDGLRAIAERLIFVDDAAFGRAAIDHRSIHIKHAAINVRIAAGACGDLALWRNLRAIDTARQYERDAKSAATNRRHGSDPVTVDQPIDGTVGTFDTAAGSQSDARAK